MKRFGQVLL